MEKVNLGAKLEKPEPAKPVVAKAKCACGKDVMDGNVQCWDCVHRK